MDLSALPRAGALSPDARAVRWRHIHRTCGQAVLVSAARCARDMRGREAPRDAGLARPRGVANTPARLRSAPPPLRKEARLSALHCGSFLPRAALACSFPDLLALPGESYSELLAHGS